MKERLFIILSFALIIAALIGLNAASFVRTEREPDEESSPNRSTYNAGATGTRAFYDFLRETGKPAVRWQEKPSALLDKNRTLPKTFVVIGSVRREFEEKEIKDLLAWTERGGRLVLIDRKPPEQLLPPAGTWLVTRKESSIPLDAKPDNVNEMTNGVKAAKPVQPTILSSMIDSVMPSKFATNIKIEYVGIEESNKPATVSVKRMPLVPTIKTAPNKNEDEALPPPIGIKEAPKEGIGIGSGTGGGIGSNSKQPPEISSEEDEMSIMTLAPVVHLANDEKVLLVDYPYGAGRIVFLSDPYIVSNGGIELVDNLQLALNLVGRDGTIAFDEYHQGFGASGNALLNFFEGTPLPAIAAQLALLILLFVYNQGRRFARPLPLPNPDRRSKLEYVSAMAELQRQTRAYDLAIENIYGRVHRNLSRFVGVDNLSTSPDALATRVAERSNLNCGDLRSLFRECEDVMCGEKINGKQALSLVTRLREIGQKLGLSKKSER